MQFDARLGSARHPKLLEVTSLSADYPLKVDGTPMNEDELMNIINEEVLIVRAENRAKRLAAYGKHIKESVNDL
jgi:hypothetical protein